MPTSATSQRGFEDGYYRQPFRPLAVESVADYASGFWDGAQHRREEDDTLAALCARPQRPASSAPRREGEQ